MVACRVPPARMLFVIAVAVAVGPAVHAESGPKVRTFAAHDSLAIPPDASDDAQQMLDDLAWTPQAFEVVAQSAVATDPFDALVLFASPRPRGHATTERVVLEWHAARGPDRQAIEAPAVLVIHSLLPSMAIGRAIARSFANRGIHAFMLHMPDYGLRGNPQAQRDGAMFMPRFKQAVCDARRARDAIAALPNIRVDHGIAIQGTSLGGFVVTVAAALDGAFDPVLLVLCGGDLFDMFAHGRFDTERVRAMLEESGFTGDRLRQLLRQVEPNRVARRLDPARTWLFSAVVDRVVPPANSDALARTIGLDDLHHLHIAGGHYTAVLQLPVVMDAMVNRIEPAPSSPPSSPPAD